MVYGQEKVDQYCGQILDFSPRGCMQFRMHHKVSSNQGSSWQTHKKSCCCCCNKLHWTRSFWKFKGLKLHTIHFENMFQPQMFMPILMCAKWKLIFYSILLCTTAQSDKCWTGLQYIQCLLIQIFSIITMVLKFGQLVTLHNAHCTLLNIKVLH